MFVLNSGFNRVTGVALGAAGMIAAEYSVEFWEVKVWTSPDAEPLLAGDGDDMPFGLAIDPRTSHIVHGTAYGHIRSSDGSELELLDGGPLRTFSISPDGTRLICGSEQWTHRRKTPAMILGYTRGGKKKHWTRTAAIEGDGSTFDHLTFFPDGKHFAVVEWSKARRGREFVRGDSPTLSVCESKGLHQIAATKFKRPADALAVCGERIVVMSGNHLKVWESPDLASKPTEVKTGRLKVTALAADPHGRFLLTASGSSVSVWEPATWRVSKTYDWKAGPVTCLAVAPDGLTAAAGTATGKVVVWDVE